MLSVVDLDNRFRFSDDGALLGEYDGTWLSIDSQPIPYADGETDSVAKSAGELTEGGKIDFVCDYYTYRFTDLYGQNYWTPVLP